MPYVPLGIGKVTSTGIGQVLPLVSRSQIANRVDIQAPIGNVGTIIIGSFDVLSDGSKGGISLAPGDVYDIELITDLVTIYVAFTNSGDSASFTYWQGDRN